MKEISANLTWRQMGVRLLGEIKTRNSDKNIMALFFTRGISLRTWDKIGNLNREIKIYNELAGYFNKIYFFTYGNKDDLDYQKFLARNIKIFPKKWNLPSSIYSLLMPLAYRKELREANILKTNQMDGAISAVLAKWLYRKKLVIRCGYEWLSFLEKKRKVFLKRKAAYFLEKICYGNADKIILTSEKDKKFLEKRFRILPKKIKVIPNYIDVDLFKPQILKKGKNRVVFIGRLSEQKNLFNLLEAINNLDVEFLIFGQGKLKEKLREKAKKIKKARIKFRENIPNYQLPKELDKSEIFVLPSFYEGCPKALLEAMSCGLSCVGTNVEGIREIIKHKENGYLCETDINSIRKAILKVLDDKKLRIKMGQNARETILSGFSLNKILEKELGIYESLL